MLFDLVTPADEGTLSGGLASVITSLGALLAAVPELDEIEINPLRATPDGRLVALDVVLGAVSDARKPHPPPPRHTVGAAVSPDGVPRSPAVAALADGQGGH